MRRQFTCLRENLVQGPQEAHPHCTYSDPGPLVPGKGGGRGAGRVWVWVWVGVCVGVWLMVWIGVYLPPALPTDKGELRDHSAVEGRGVEDIAGAGGGAAGGEGGGGAGGAGRPLVLETGGVGS